MASTLGLALAELDEVALWVPVLGPEAVAERLGRPPEVIHKAAFVEKGRVRP